MWLEGGPQPTRIVRHDRTTNQAINFVSTIGNIHRRDKDEYSRKHYERDFRH
jgi:hypothetical protein